MSHELHYTSAPRGLKPGSRGFATVACTAGLSPTLAERLEALSGYRQVFPPHHARAADNPVAWSHLVVTVASKPYHVVSRVGAAGLDYSDRANKYAHHIALEPSERPAGGPGWLLRQPGYLESAWSGTPRVLPGARSTPRGDRVAAPCAAWREAAGDAGWAGVVAQAFLDDPKRAVYLVYEPGADLLPLIDEALGLLPPSRRWEVTFSTYFTSLPPETQCQWRGVLLDSAEARQAARIPNALVLDLTQPLGRAPDGPLVEAARTGILPPTLTPPTAPLLVPAAPDADPYAPPVYADRYRPGSAPEPDHGHEPADGTALRVVPDLPLDLRPRARVRPGRAPSRRNRTLLIAGSVGAVLLALGSAVLWNRSQPQLGSTPASLPSDPGAQTQKFTPRANPVDGPLPVNVAQAATSVTHPTSELTQDDTPKSGLKEQSSAPESQPTVAQQTADATPKVSADRRIIAIEDFSDKTETLPLGDSPEDESRDFRTVDVGVPISRMNVLGLDRPDGQDPLVKVSPYKPNYEKTLILTCEYSEDGRKTLSGNVGVVMHKNTTFGIKIYDGKFATRKDVTDALRDMVVRLDLADRSIVYVMQTRTPVRVPDGLLVVPARADGPLSSAPPSKFEICKFSFGGEHGLTLLSRNSLLIEKAFLSFPSNESLRLNPDQGVKNSFRGSLDKIQLQLSLASSRTDSQEPAQLELRIEPSQRYLQYSIYRLAVLRDLGGELARAIEPKEAGKQNAPPPAETIMGWSRTAKRVQAQDIGKQLDSCILRDEEGNASVAPKRFHDAAVKIISQITAYREGPGGEAATDKSLKVAQSLINARLCVELVRQVGEEKIVTFMIGTE